MFFQRAVGTDWHDACALGAGEELGNGYAHGPLVPQRQLIERPLFLFENPLPVPKL